MNWYLVKLVFQIGTGPANQFDEQMRLLQADEVDWAVEKARVVGWLEQTAGWRFIDVADIHRIDKLEDGIHVCSSTTEVTNAEEYIRLTKLNFTKALQLAHQEFASTSERLHEVK
ncbi:MAG: DUF4288 domain-containing protein [Cyclobacteriaceae bacterium]|nr:DUF4288 domain-containing protein [Cyclobacteriaceae bacterium]